MADPVVLVVDDEPLIRMTLADGLESCGFVVVEAEDADEALTVLQTRNDIAALVTDVKMPGSMDGLDLAQLVAARWIGMPIFVISGHARSDDSRLPRGAAFIQKPFSVSELGPRLKARLH